MILRSITLQNFRNYKKSSFTLPPGITVVVGQNASGKSNFIEAIFLLATGKSYRGAPPSGGEAQLIRFEEDVARVEGVLDDEMKLAVVLSRQQPVFKKKYLVNGIPRRRVDFAGNLTVVLFTPEDLDIVAGQPSVRRRFLDEVLEQTDPEYRQAHITYTKALRQRNALLEQVQETGVRNEQLFSYWDNLLITNGQILSGKREKFIAYVNAQEKKLFPFVLEYDKSEISHERLLQYRAGEVGAGVTLVGPHRDDVFIKSFHPIAQELEDVKYFSSRGQQRLVALELKLSQISYLKEQSGVNPVLLLDDIFSELDSSHIEHVLALMYTTQTIFTTTHKEFVASISLQKANVIELRQ